MPETTSSPVLDVTSPEAKPPSCAVLVMSCDAYRDLWTPFFTLFWRYWPDCPFQVYLGTNGLTFDDARVRTLTAGDHEWGQRLRLHLAEIDSGYVLLLLEDYFFIEPIATQEIVGALCALERLSGTVLRLSPLPGPDSPLDTYGSIGEIDRLASYRVSTQAAIWNRSTFLSLLRDNESIWDFERKGSSRSQGVSGGFYCSYSSVLPYRQVLERGQWFWSAASFFGKQQIGCDFAARPVMSGATAFRKAVVRRSKNLLDRVLPPRLRFRI